MAKTNTSGTYANKLHALSLIDGTEKFGGPTTVAGTSGAVTFDPRLHQARAGLLLLNSHVYAAFTSHCDQGPWYGWIYGFDAGTLAITSVYCTTPAHGGGSIWQSGKGLVADASGNIYCATGNAPGGVHAAIDGSSNTTDKAMAVLKLSTPTDAAR